MSIREWRRIRKHLEGIPDRGGWRETIQSLGWSLVGVAIPTVITFIVWLAPYGALPANDRVTYAFVAPLLLTTAIGTLLMGIVLLLVSGRLKGDEQRDVKDILADMDDIEALLSLPPK